MKTPKSQTQKNRRARSAFSFNAFYNVLERIVNQSNSNVQGLNTAAQSRNEQCREYNESLLSADQAKDLFFIEGGALINRVMRGRRALPGQTAGSPDGNGYLTVKINCVKYRVHRLIWLISFGRWPAGQIDHINGVRDDNRIENLREVSVQDNQRNQHIRIDNSSGVPGVSNTGYAWVARIKVDGRNLYIGSFKSFEEAVSARKSAEASYGFHFNHGGTDYQRRTSLTQEVA